MTEHDYPETIDLVVKVNGEEMRRWEMRMHPRIVVRQRRWGRWRNDQATMTCVGIDIDGERFTAVGDHSELVVDVPIEVTT